jgi:cob(I)alamin adenosyltransferase
LARQFVQDGGVKHKSGMHMLGMLQRQAERRVVVQAQIAAKPHQNAVKLV